MENYKKLYAVSHHYGCHTSALQKDKSSMASDNKAKKQTVLVIVQNLPQDIIMGQVNRNLHPAKKLKQ